MEILYIIGNGFDLNLGLKTSYKDFYQYYKTLEVDNQNVQKLKDNISQSYESWADLELALGNYTQHLEKLEELDDILLDIGEKLSKYLHHEEGKLENCEFNKIKFFDYLCFPENLFLPADKEKLIEIKSKWHNYQWNLNIYTFNILQLLKRCLETIKKMFYSLTMTII